MNNNRARRITALALCLSALAAGMTALAASDGEVTGGNLAPVAKNLDVATYRGVAVTGKFEASDPEGEAVTFEITSQPKYGTVEKTGEDAFVYTPEGKKGSDSFKFTAKDEKGAVSSEATAKITVKKQVTNVMYSDMEGSDAHYAALRLAEEGVFTGDKLGEERFFRPTATVSRSEFLAMCMAAAGDSKLEGVTATGFADDEASPAWAKPYVAAALMSGDIRGYEDEEGKVVFSPEDPVTYYEAAVMLNNVFGLSDAVSVAVTEDEACPAWAKNASANLLSAGVKTTVADKNAPITRAEAAKLLTEAMDTVSARKTGGFFSLFG